MKNVIFKYIGVYLAMTSMVVTDVSAKRSKKVTEVKQGQITPDQLYIVDCLLPPQIRQLGQNFTYIPPRKPAKLTAKECALRGGEYVAYDESNFATVAKVWKQQADGGDATAQNYMGELFERGINGTPDYQSAAAWYQKAADQGLSAAQLNLGNLYEKGLGVPQDAVKAINLYRQAAGVTEAKLELVTEQDLRDRREKEHQRIQLERQVFTLKNELSAVNENYQKTQDYIQSANTELQRLQAELREKNDDPRVKQQIAELEQQVKDLTSKNAESRELASTLVRKIAAENGQELAMNTDQFGINVITPDILLTRGIRSIPIANNQAKSMSIMGSVNPPEEVAGLTLNNENITDKLTDTGIFSVDVPLIENDDTPVSIEAVKNDGSKSVERFVVVRQLLEQIKPRYLSDIFTKRFKQDLGTYHALVIGNNNYNDLEDLGTAINDAQQVGKVLSENYGYQTQILENATHLEIVQALADYQEKLGKLDNLVVYYAGHGLIDERQDGYWIPTDAKLDDKKTWIPNNVISEFMSSMNAKHVMVIADSCYSGTMSGSAIRPFPEDVAENDILFTSRVKARTVLTSGGLQPVLDSGGDGHSIFASALLDVLKENDGVMEGYRLYKALDQQVRLRSKLTGIQQSPEYTAVRHAGHEGSEFYFLPASI
ncbi:caspase family protein [Marinicella meishanensis]|uniref:caspase family protein n=1 Tax=Marinicella meishanensis TaxID=2873263 RepID=UPI001CC079C9|nr:caspase family protein [Marinicella sp. NBU2979]